MRARITHVPIPLSLTPFLLCTPFIHACDQLFMPMSTYVRSSQHVRAEHVIYRVSQSNLPPLVLSEILFSYARVSKQIDLPPGNGRSLREQTRTSLPKIVLFQRAAQTLLFTAPRQIHSRDFRFDDVRHHEVQFFTKRVWAWLASSYCKIREGA